MVFQMSHHEITFFLPFIIRFLLLYSQILAFFLSHGLVVDIWIVKDKPSDQLIAAIVIGFEVIASNKRA
jgi:hypothetical protein